MSALDARTTAAPTLVFKPQRQTRRPDWLGATLTPILSGIGGLALWELVVYLNNIPPYLLPPPSLVAVEIIENWPRLLRNLGFTATASILGFVVALMLGILLGAVFTASRPIERIVYPWLVIFHAIPKVVVAPLFLVWIGFGMKSETIFVIVFTIFPILVNTVTGLKAADPDLLQLVRSMGASKVEALWKIRLPAALPTIMAGIKIAATMAPVGAVIGEFVASNVGLGHLLIQAVSSLETPLAFAAVVVISVFGIAIWYLAESVERWLIPWHASVRLDGAR